MRTLKNRRGQSMVEYIIIVVVVALAALAIFGVFSDRLRGIMGGAVDELGGDTSKTDAALDKNAVDKIKDLDHQVGQ